MGEQVRSRPATFSRFIPPSLHGPAARRVRVRPAQVGPVPRMLDHLKRRCNHLLLTSDSAAAATPDVAMIDPAAGSVNIHRTPGKVLLHSSDVRDLLAYWNNRSAFKSEQEISNESTALPSTSKLSLLVWRAPELQVPLIPAAGATPVRLIKACHVIPVTLLEAAQFQHIPVEMRAGMIPATLRTHIDAKMDALMQHLRPSVAQ